MAQRQRFSRAIQGTLDANGRGSLKVSPPPSSAYWAVLTLAASGEGTPNWTVSVNGNEIQSSSGPSVVLSLHPLGPGETLDIDLNNGPQNSSWSGTLYGTLTDDEQDAMSLYQPSMAAGSSTRVQAPIVALKQQPADSGIYTFSDVVLHTLTLNLPPNTQGFRWKWKSNAGCTFTLMNVKGATTGNTLNPYNGASFDGQVVGAQQQNDQFFILEPTDTQLILTVQLAAGDISTELDAYVSPIVVAAQIVGTIGVLDGFAFVVRTSQTAQAAPWERPRACAVVGQVIAGGATAVIVAGVGGKLVTVFPTSMSVDVAVATGAAAMEDTAAVAFHQFNLGAIIMNPFLASGFPLSATGLGVQLHNLTGGAITLRGSIPYTQV